MLLEEIRNPSTLEATTASTVPALRTRTLRSFMFMLVGVQRVASLLVTAGGGIILARLLMPEVFGLYAVISFAVGDGVTFGDLGLGAALVQRKDLDPAAALAVAFTSHLGLALGLAAAIVGLAPSLTHWLGLAQPAVGPLWMQLAGRWRVVGWGGLILFLLGNSTETSYDARTAGPPVARVVDGLHSRVIKFLYTSYFIAYPLLFLSRDAIVASPAVGPVNVERGSAHTGVLTPSLRHPDVFRRDAEAPAMFIREMREHGDAFVHEQVDEFDDYIPDRHVDPDDLRLVRQFEGE